MAGVRQALPRVHETDLLVIPFPDDCGVILLTAFAFAESRVSNPLLPLRVVLDRARGGSYIAVGLTGIAVFGIFLFLTYYLQDVKGYSPVTSGLAFLPMIACILLSSNLSSIVAGAVPAASPALTASPAGGRRRRAEATIALAGPLARAVLAAGTGLLYFATRNGAFAAAAAWMALINLFNLLPVVPLDGGRVVKSISCSVGSRTGLVAVIAGMLLGAVLAVTADLWIFVILIPLGLLDYLYDSYQVNQAAWRPKPGAGRHARIAEAQDDAELAGTGLPAAKPPLRPRAAQAAFASYAGLAILLWLFILAMGHQPGAVAAMHALQG